MRDPFFDVCKFFAMYMVVLGHIMLAHGVTFLEPYILNAMGFYWTRVSVCSMWLLALRFLLGVAGIIAFMMIVDRMCQTFKWFMALSFFGSTTLGVYLIHMKFLPYCKLFYESGNVAFALLETTVLFVICHYITSWTQCCPIVSKLLWWSSGRSKK